MIEIDGIVQITHHEGAIICSYETTLDCQLEKAKEKNLACINQVQCFVDEENGLIGHIKAHAMEQGRGITFSSTGGDITVIAGNSEETEISFTAIVFFVDEKRLRDIVENQFSP